MVAASLWRLLTMLARVVARAGNLPHGVNQERIPKFIQETVSQAVANAPFSSFSMNPPKCLRNRLESDAVTDMTVCTRGVMACPSWLAPTCACVESGVGSQASCVDGG